MTDGWEECPVCHSDLGPPCAHVYKVDDPRDPWHGKVCGYPEAQHDSYSHPYVASTPPLEDDERAEMADDLDRALGMNAARSSTPPLIEGDRVRELEEALQEALAVLEEYGNTPTMFDNLTRWWQTRCIPTVVRLRALVAPAPIEEGEER